MGRPLGSTNKETWQSVDYSLPMGNLNETEPQIAHRIEKTFRVLHKLVNGVSTSNLRGMIVSGARGCGKTYEIENTLNQTVDSDNFHLHSGALSNVGLYKNLYHMRGAGQIFVADDCDNIYFSTDALNLLKVATDPKKTGRIISWGKESWALLADKNDGEEIPKEFEYYGACIFCTNLDLRSEAQKNNRVSRHQSALIDRSPYLDLGIHTKREILVRIWYVMQKTNFLTENDISIEIGNTIFSWIRDNLSLIQSPSIRTALQLADMIKIDEDNWEELASVTMFRR
jgi:hypothetical protein